MASESFLQLSPTYQANSLAALTDDDLFHFPRPPARFEGREGLHSRPSLPTLRTAFETSSAAHLACKSPSVSIQDHAGLPGPALQTDRLVPSHSASTESSYGWEFYSPMISGINSPDTSSTSLAPSLSSDAETHDPLTPNTPHSSGLGWRPKELNLLRRRERAVSGEGHMPSYQASFSWQTSGASIAERSQTIGLGITSIATTTAGLQYQNSIARRSRGSTSSNNLGGTSTSGHKGLLLCSAGTIAPTRRFQSPAERSRQNSFSSATTAPEVTKSRSLRIPVLPSTPTFTSLPPDGVDSRASSRSSSSLTAEEFVARLRARSEIYTSIQLDRPEVLYGSSGHDPDRRDSDPGYDANETPMSIFDLPRGSGDPVQSHYHHFEESEVSTQAASPSFSTSSFRSGSPGFSRPGSQASSRRKAPPARLVLGPSPRSTRGGSLPPSASTTTTAQPQNDVAGELAASELSPAPESASPARDAAGAQATDSETTAARFQDHVSNVASTSTEGKLYIDAPAPKSCLLASADAEASAGVYEGNGVALQDAESAPSSAESTPHGTVSSMLPYQDPTSDVLVSPVERQDSFAPIPDAMQSFLNVDFDASFEGDQTLNAALEPSNPPTFAGGLNAGLTNSLWLSDTPADKALDECELRDTVQELPAEEIGSKISWAESRSLKTLSMRLQQPVFETAFRLSILAPDATSPRMASFGNMPGSSLDYHKDTPTSNLGHFGDLSSLPSTEIESARTDSPTDPTHGKLHKGAAERAEKPPAEAHEAPDGDAKWSQMDWLDAQERPGSTLGRTRAPSIVPPPPQFAINSLTSRASGITSAPVTAEPEPLSAMLARSTEAEDTASTGLSSRWSSGSESEAGSVASAISMGRKASSRNSKKLTLSTSRKNSFASLSRTTLNSPALSDMASSFSSTSKVRLPSQSYPKSPAPNSGKKSFLSSLTGWKKKDDAEVLASPSHASHTPSSSYAGSIVASPVSDGRHEFPFPRIEVANCASAGSRDAKSPVLSEFHMIPSPPPSAPLTTKQILAQARDNVWPELHSAGRMRDTFLPEQVSVPVLHADRDAYRAALRPSMPSTAPPINEIDLNTPPLSAPLPRTLHRKVHGSGRRMKPKEAHYKELPILPSRGNEIPAVYDVAEQTPAAPSPRSAPKVGRRKAKAKKAQQIALFRNEWPHRTSMTDIGREWLRGQGLHAFEALESECAPYLFALSSSGAGQQRDTHAVSSGRYVASSGSEGSESDDTDDYGSSDGGGGGNGGGGAGSGGRGHRPDGDDDGDDGDDDSDGSNNSSDEDRHGDEEEDEDVSTDEDSEDDYGSAEDESRDVETVGGPRVPQGSRQAGAPGEESDSSDDRPLGELVQDPEALQQSLREAERRKHIESSRSALEKGPIRGTSQRTLKKLAAKAARQRALALSQDAQPNGSEGDSSLDLAELTSRLARVQSRRHGATLRSPPAGQPTFGLPPTSGTDSDRAMMQGGLNRARSINRPQADAASLDRSKTLRTRPSDPALQARFWAQAPGQPAGVAAPNLPNNAAATIAAAQKAVAHAQANPSAANRAHAKAMAAAASAAMEILSRSKRSATITEPAATLDTNPLSPPATAPLPGVGANLTRHRTEIGPASRIELRRPSVSATPSAHPMVGVKSLQMPAGAEGVGLGAQSDAERVSVPLVMGNRPRARSRAHIAAINTNFAPPLPDLTRLLSPALKSPGPASPLTPTTSTSFAALQQRAEDSIDNELSRDGGSGSGGAGGEESFERSVLAAAIPLRTSSSATSPPPGVAASLSTDSNLATSHRARFKVFVINKQRFTTSEIPPTARARELVLDVIEREQVPLDESKGGWVVFDCSPDLGIDRPLREYEIVHEVADRRANVNTDYFLLKRTELSPYLSLRAVPASSPSLAGYVYVQDRKKKWSKRWLELRDHALFHAKSEKGKDEVMICQMSNFDVYLVDTAKIKTPKAHAFALRSQDKITMFEKPDQDYIHYFALSDPAAHRDWVRAIMNARTYILRQERAVLFKPPPIPGAAMASPDAPGTHLEAASAGVSRSATSGGGLSRRNTARRPGGRNGGGVPGVPDGANGHAGGATGGGEGAALISRDAFSGPFEKGSLLADIAIKSASEAMRAVPATSYATQEARRREEAIERQRRLRSEGQPLVDLSKK
ncbi:hypothetical protein ACQY0O_006320 [Thecaphora frezii]